MTDFDLSEKRGHFFKETMDITTTPEERILVDSIFCFIKIQDKEFIRLLKEELILETEMVKRIDKLAGDKLNG